MSNQASTSEESQLVQMGSQAVNGTHTLALEPEHPSTMETPKQAAQADETPETTKINGREQALVAASILKTSNTHTLVFQSSFVRRAFKKNFYRWSLSLIELGAHKPVKVFALQESLSRLLELNAKSPEYLCILEKAEHEEVVAAEPLTFLVLDGQCEKLLKSFVAVDEFLTPVYKAYISEKITKDEFEAEKARIACIFDLFKSAFGQRLERPRAHPPGS